MSERKRTKYPEALQIRKGDPDWLKAEKEWARDPARLARAKPWRAPKPVEARIAEREPRARVGVPFGREGEEPTVEILPESEVIEREVEAEELYSPEEVERRESLRFEPSAGYVTESVPTSDWKYKRVGDDICAEREVDIVQLDPRTATFDEKKQKWVGEGVRIVKPDVEIPPCVHVSRTVDCLRERDGNLSDCERVKVALACSQDETGAQLTKSMISEVAEVSVDKAQQCASELMRDGLVMTPTQVARTVTKGERVPTYPKDKGEAYFIMGKEKAKEVLSQ